MGKRVALVLSGCGPDDGSEIREAVLSLLSLERAGAEVICTAPDVEQTRVFDHARGAVDGGAAPRRVLAESARIARGKIRPLSELQVSDFDALVFPGGAGVGTALSNYHDRGDHCDVHPDVARLLKGALAAHKPIGLVCLAPILAARVLGPVAGVHITLGPRGTAASKHAAVMGADVRPCPANDIFVDPKNRIVSTPAYMYDDVKLTEVAHAIEKLVRAVLQLARGDRPAFDSSRGLGRPAPRPPGPGPAAPRAQTDLPRVPRKDGGPVLRRPGGAPARGPENPRGRGTA